MLKYYKNKLTDKELKQVIRKKSERKYKFGDNEPITSTESVSLPMTIAGKEVMLRTDVIEGNLPLLLSKTALKKAEAVINFKDDTIDIFGKKENLLESSSGHYMIPVQNHLDSKIEPKITYSLITKDDDVKKKAMKIHRHFSHAPKKRLQKLLENAGMWDNEMNEALTELESTCRECKIYSKPLSRPIVGMAIANSFNEFIAMDLKDVKEGDITHKLLHIVDYYTRFGQCIRVKSKKKEEIVQAWLQLKE